MGKVSLLYDKSSDRGTLSGGRWVATDTIGINNMRTRDLKEIARTVSLAAADTQFRVDTGGNPPGSWQQFFLLNHNLSSAATVRFVVTDDPADAPANRQYDSGMVTAWEATETFGGKAWGSFDWQGIDLAGYPAGPVVLHLAPVAVLGRYCFVYLLDPNNPAGYLELGRFIAGVGWQPGINAAWGASTKWRDNSTVRRTRGGLRLVDPAPVYREMILVFEALTQREALGVGFEIDKRIGKRGDMVVIQDPDDAPDMRYRRAMYCSMIDTGAITSPNVDHYGWGVNLEELI